MTRWLSKEKFFVNFSYIILFFATFNDVFRIVGSLSFFRLLLPFALIVLYINEKKTFFILIKLVLVFATIHLFLHIISCMSGPELQMNILYYLYFLFHYTSIFVVISFAIILLRIDNANNYTNFKLFIILLFILTLAINYIRYFYDSSFLANVNNYSASIAAFSTITPSFFKKRKSMCYIFILLSIVATYLHDSKLALIGIIFVIAMYITIHIYLKTTKNRRRKLLSVFFSIFLLIALLLVINPKINSYSLREIIYQPIKNIFEGVLIVHPQNNATSIQFRTNSTIIMLQGIKQYWYGIGIGNSGRYLYNTYTTYQLEEARKTFGEPILSPHNSLLEVVLDNGILIVVMLLYFFLRALSVLLQKKMFIEDYQALVYTLSLPIWMTAPSTFYTLFLVFIIGTYVYYPYFTDKVLKL